MKKIFLTIITCALVITNACSKKKNTTDPVKQVPDAPATTNKPGKDYTFSGGTIRPDVLKNYLDRALQMYEYCKADEFTQFGNPNPYRDDDKRLILNTGAKFVGRVIFSFAEDEKLNNPKFFQYAKDRITDLHKSDPNIIFQACIFETATTKANNIAIPAWVFEAFGLPVVTRNFDNSKMLYTSGARVDQWGKGASVPDISQLETRLWFYWLAKQYIDTGIEALHWGQVEIMAEVDKNNDYKGWKDIFNKVRSYALKHARRGTVIFDGHVPSGGLKDASGHLLLDFNSFPLRPKEDGLQAAHGTILQTGYSDAFFGRSKGGITPSGWVCLHLPYLLELDSFGDTSHPGVADNNFYNFDVWGYDEIGWFARQPESYRNNWIKYARNWIAATDPGVGYMIITGAGPGGIFKANTKSPSCPDGKNAEETIKAMWQKDIVK